MKIRKKVIILSILSKLAIPAYMLLYSVMMIPDILKFVGAVQIVTYAPKWHFMIPLTLNICFHTFFLTHVADTNIVCSSPFKKGEPKF